MERIDISLPQIITDNIIMIETIEDIRNKVEYNDDNKEENVINRENIFGLNKGDKISLKIIIPIPKTEI